MSASGVLLAGVAILGLAAGGPSPTGDVQETWSHSGFVEARGWSYEGRPNRGDVRALGDLRGEFGVKRSIRDSLSLRGRWDFRLDTEREVDRRRWLDLDQRGLRQPAGTLGELYLDFALKHVDVRVGTQEIHWGRADGINPTDNVDPYDYSYPFSPRRLAVPAVRAQTDFGRTGLEGVWVPFFTPARLPLLGKRWYPRLPNTALAPLGPAGQEVAVDVAYHEGARTFPARTLANGQWGVRWNQLVPRGEFSVSFLDTFNDVGYLSPTTRVDPGGPVPRLAVVLDRHYFRMRVVGFDFASELGPVGVRGEMALVDETDPDDLDRLVYVVGLDRRWGDWFLIAQYADRIGGRALADTPVFPNLGLRSTLLSRIERTIDPSQTLELRTALGLRDRDMLMQLSYSLAITDAWKLTLAGALVGGSRAGFLGQYRGNDNLSVQLRRSF
jgi:hypothetical protein